jgi:hypothetical protein
MKNLYIYKLVVEYPEGADAPGWYPAVFDNREVRSLLSIKERWGLRGDKKNFRWPRTRNIWISHSACWRRAWLLHTFGCRVVILRSDPLSFNSDIKRDLWGIAQNW